MQVLRWFESQQNPQHLCSTVSCSGPTITMLRPMMRPGPTHQVGVGHLNYWDFSLTLRQSNSLPAGQSPMEKYGIHGVVFLPCLSAGWCHGLPTHHTECWVSLWRCCQNAKKNNQPELQEQGSPPIVWGPKSSLHPQYLGFMLDTSTSEWIDKQIENSGGCRREASCHFFDAAILLLRVACTLQSGPLKG